MPTVPLSVLADLFDQTEAAAGERIGGRTDKQRDLINRAWTAILRTRSDTVADLAWKRGMLERAVDHGWETEWTLPLLDSIQAVWRGGRSFWALRSRFGNRSGRPDRLSPQQGPQLRTWRRWIVERVHKRIVALWIDDEETLVEHLVARCRLDVRRGDWGPRHRQIIGICVDIVNTIELRMCGA
jgi:hypothetical protein